MRKPIIIKELGKLFGRDAIFLDDFDWKYQTVKLSGEFNGNLCENKQPKKYIPYEITFSGVIEFKVTAIDFYDDSEYTSSFEEITDSDWVLKRHCKHFVFHDYDHTLEIIADKFDLKIDNKSNNS